MGNPTSVYKVWLLRIAPVISIGLFILVWMLASRANPEFVASPIGAIQRLIEIHHRPINNLNVFGHAWASLRRVLISLSAASVLGIAFGMSLALNRTFNAIFGTIFDMLRPIPPIAWIPLIILWFGIGEFPKQIIVFIACFVSITLNTFAGVKMVDPLVIDVGRAFGVKSWRLILEIIFPSALPTIFAGFRISLSAGWMSVLAAEMIASRSGLGFLITRGMESLNTAQIIISMIMIGIVGSLLSVLLIYVERWLCPWKDSK